MRESTQVVAAVRLRKRKFDKPGLVKISFSTLQENIQVLRNKRKLETSEKFKRVFLKSSKSHTDRIIELNARTLLKEIPHGNPIQNNLKWANRQKSAKR